MKKIIVLMLFCLVVVGGFTQSFSTANEVAPMPTVASPIISFVPMATPTLTMGASAQAVTGLPAGCKGFIVRCTTGVDINYGGSDVVAGAGWPKIASGEEKAFYITPHKAPTIYFVSTATGTPTIRFTCFK